MSRQRGVGLSSVMTRQARSAGPFVGKVVGMTEMEQTTREVRDRSSA